MGLVPLWKPAQVVERAPTHLVGDHAGPGLERGPVSRRVAKAGSLVALMPGPT
jgi:hypothetical protein